MNNITVLTDIKQLAGKTIKLINVYTIDETTTTFWTDCNHILVESKKIASSYGDEYVETTYMKDMVEIYEFHEDDLVDWNIVTQNDANALQGLVVEKERHLNQQRLDRQEHVDRIQYEKLKQKFEVEWKL